MKHYGDLAYRRVDQRKMLDETRAVRRQTAAVRAALCEKEVAGAPRGFSMLLSAAETNENRQNASKKPASACTEGVHENAPSACPSAGEKRRRKRQKMARFV